MTHTVGRELRAVWYEGETVAESCSAQDLAAWIAKQGRAPDAFGLYRAEPDGTQTHEMDFRTLPPATLTPSPEDWVCPDCGSDQIHATAWIDLRTGLDTGDEGPLSDYWCCQCEDHIPRLIQRKEWQEDAA